jgi:predicted  nucleic acid-binding Zn-ribbon protein
MAASPDQGATRAEAESWGLAGISITAQRRIAMTVKQDFSDQLKAQIDVWQAQIKNYQEQLEQASEKARADYQKAIAQMQANAEEANKLLQKVREAGESAWTDMQNATQKAFEQLQKGWADALGRFM